MLCSNCSAITPFFLCKNCKSHLKNISHIHRKLKCGLDVFSFYHYLEIKKLILLKHKLSGYFALNLLAKYSFKKFAKNYDGDLLYSLSLDDSCEHGYSHSAILNHHLKSKNIKPIYGAILAKNNVKYSGKSLQYRQNHKRNFYFNKKVKSPVVLVDDIVTTGLSLSQAYELCKKNDIVVMFALTLADASHEI